jgi:hypothetical protein
VIFTAKENQNNGCLKSENKEENVVSIAPASPLAPLISLNLKGITLQVKINQ